MFEFAKTGRRRHREDVVVEETSFALKAQCPDTKKIGHSDQVIPFVKRTGSLAKSARRSGFPSIEKLATPAVGGGIVEDSSQPRIGRVLRPFKQLKRGINWKSARLREPVGVIGECDRSAWATLNPAKFADLSQRSEFRRIKMHHE